MDNVIATMRTSPRDPMRILAALEALPVDTDLSAVISESAPLLAERRTSSSETMAELAEVGSKVVVRNNPHLIHESVVCVIKQVGGTDSDSLRDVTRFVHIDICLCCK